MKNRFEKWERTRLKGKWKFIFKYGVFFWGLGTAILFSLFFSMVLKITSFLRILPIALVLFPLGGIVWGATMWYFTEKYYHKHKPIISPLINNQ